jgi:hypothetical protein
MSATDPSRPDHAQRGSILRARVAVAPANADSPLFAAVVGFSYVSTYEVPAGQWMTVAGGLPSVGDDCVLLIDHLGDVWAQWNWR